MKVSVHMLAFYDELDKVREVDIPESMATKPVKEALDEVFYWGQNDFQPQDCCSVSVADVIYYQETYWMVMPIGFKKITQEQFDDHKQAPRASKFFDLYTMDQGCA